VAIPLAIVGFKKHNKILAALSLLLITGTYGVAEVYHKRKGIPKQSNEMISDAKALYENNCSSCHGANGKLGMSGSKDLSKTQLDLAGINQIIIQGKGMMPAASQLSPEQAQAVAEYVNTSIKGQ
jgi:mono/diheme cytochrome c family protein